ncbi:MAG: hypothetical protein ACE5FT_01490 [Candidatus Nanoarchaeia archaeon]
MFSLFPYFFEEVLEKLIEKDLVSYFTKGGVKYYKAASPKMIQAYLDEKKKALDKQQESVSEILPSLLELAKAKEFEKEAVVFSGARGIRTAFRNLVDELNKGDEVHIMGVYKFGDQFKRLALFFQKIRSEKGIKGKFLMNTDAKYLAKAFKKYPPIEVRYLPENVMTPAIFLIYKDKVIINLADEMTFFVLTSKSTALAFDTYFNLLWKNAKK